MKAISIALIIGLAIAVIIVSVALIVKQQNINNLMEELDGANENIVRLDDELSSAKLNITELGNELEQVKGENVKLNEEIKAGGEFYEGKISSLETELAEKTELSDKLSLELQKRRLQKGINLALVKNSLEDLERYVEDKSPLVRLVLTEEEIEELKSKVEDESEIPDHVWVDAEKYINNAKKNLGDKYNYGMSLGELLEAGGQTATSPTVAVYYEDLVSGYKYSYNGDLVFDAASVMKAPYITAVLGAYTDYKNGEIKPDAKDERYSAEKLEEMFNFEKSIVLDEENTDVEGSGVLKDEPLGTEVPFEDLFKYALKNSDNIAFRIIKKTFTNKWYYSFVREHGVKSPLTYEMNLTANEAGKLFKEIYYFTVENEEYGEFVKENLASSAHSVLSKSVLPNSIHKYGWDKNAYHDAAIVYGDRPYVAIVFTDIDSGGTKADAYIREIFKKIAAFHNSLA